MLLSFTDVRGVNSARGPDSSFGGDAGYVCLGSGKSTSRSGKRRARGRRDTRKGTMRGTESQRTNTQPHDMDDHEYGVMRTNTFWSHDVWFTSLNVRTVQEKK